tara:strand:- start:912 stop:1193 length:282 start_codon:yes stop_codon:yes gene_type:complete
MNNMFFVTFFIIFCTSIILIFITILDKISINNKLDELIKYSKKNENQDLNRYIINVDPSFNSTLHDRESAIEKMSQVQLVLGKDKIYKRTILK